MEVDRLTFRIHYAGFYGMFHGLNNFFGKVDVPETLMVTKTAICRVLSALEPVTMIVRNKRRAEGGISPDIENPVGSSSI